MVLGHFVVFMTEQINCSIHNKGTFAGENYSKFAQAKLKKGKCFCNCNCG